MQHGWLWLMPKPVFLLKMIINNTMPSCFFQQANGNISAFANRVVSLDNLLILSSAMLLGEAAGAAAGATVFNAETVSPAADCIRSLAVSSSKLKWLGKMLVPGIPIFRFSSRSKLISTGNVIANIGIEMTKLSFYTYIGAKVGGRDGVEMASHICIFSAGFFSGLLSRIGNIFMREVMSGEAGNLSTVVTAADDNAGDVSDALVGYAGGSPVLKSFSLSRALHIDSWFKRLGAFQGQIVRDVQKIGQLKGDIDKLLKSDPSLGTAHTASEIDKAANLLPQSKAIQQLEEIRDGLRRKISSSRGGDVRAPLVTGGKGIPEKGGKGGGGGGSKVRPLRDAAETAVPSEAASGATRQLTDKLRAYLKNPPIEISERIISEATGNKVSVTDGVLKEIIEAYSGMPPPSRRVFWRSLGDLMEDDLRVWQNVASKGSKFSLYKATIGDWHLFVQNDGGSYKLVGLQHK